MNKSGWLIGFALWVGPLLLQSEDTGSRTHLVTPTVVHRRYPAVGSLLSRTQLSIYSQVNGTVIEISRREGERIGSGEMLVKIQRPELFPEMAGAKAMVQEATAMRGELEKSTLAAIAQRDQIKSKLDLARLSRERIRQLFEKNSVSKQEYDAATADLHQAEAAFQGQEAQIQSLEARRNAVVARLEQARAGVGRVETMANFTLVTAPFVARVVSRAVEPGLAIQPGAKLLTVEDPDHFLFQASVPASLIASLAIGLSVPVTLDAIPHPEFAGAVAEILPAADPFSQTFAVKIALSPHPLFKTGLFGRAYFPDGTESLLLVPRSFLEIRGHLNFVSVTNSGKTNRRMVKVGREFPNGMEILGGLRAGEILAPPPTTE